MSHHIVEVFFVLIHHSSLFLGLHFGWVQPVLHLIQQFVHFLLSTKAYSVFVHVSVVQLVHGVVHQLAHDSHLCKPSPTLFRLVCKSTAMAFISAILVIFEILDIIAEVFPRVLVILILEKISSILYCTSWILV